MTTLIKLPAALADIGIGLIIMRSFRTRRALVLAAYVLNPAVWYVSAFWGQIDSVYAFFLTGSVFLLERNRIASSWLSYTLAMLIKVLAIPIAPVLLVGTWLKRRGRGVLRGMITVVVVSLLVGVPWLLQGDIAGPVQGSFRVANRQPRLVMSGYNFWYLVRRGNVHEVSSHLRPGGLPITYLDISFALFALLQIAVIALMWRADFPPITLAAAAACLGFFLLATEIHERYLLPTLGLVLMAAAMRPRLWWVYGILLLTFLFNLITVIPFTPLLGSNLVVAEPLTPGVIALKFLALVAAVMNVVALVWVLYEMGRDPICRSGVRA